MIKKTISKLFICSISIVSFSFLCSCGGGNPSKDLNNDEESSEVDINYSDISVGSYSDDDGEASLQLSAKVNKALNDEDYVLAYALIDPWVEQHYRTTVRETSFTLNQRVLKNEIANLISSDKDGENGMKIYFAITERAKYNSYWASCEYDGGAPDTELKQRGIMLEYARNMAELDGKETLLKKLNNIKTQDQEE